MRNSSRVNGSSDVFILFSQKVSTHKFFEVHRFFLCMLLFRSFLCFVTSLHPVGLSWYHPFSSFFPRSEGFPPYDRLVQLLKKTKENELHCPTRGKSKPREKKQRSQVFTLFLCYVLQAYIFLTWFPPLHFVFSVLCVVFGGVRRLMWLLPV